MEVVRSVGGGALSEDAFADLRDGEKIKQEKTTADCPEVNGVTQRAIGIIDTTGLAAKL